MIILAQGEAENKSSVINTGHLLAAMFSPHLNDSKLQKLLLGYDDLTYGNVQGRINHDDKDNPTPKDDSFCFTFSFHFKRLLEESYSIAQKVRDPFICENHFFSAICNMPDCQAYKILAEILGDKLSLLKTENSKMLCESIIYETIKQILNYFADLDKILTSGKDDEIVPAFLTTLEEIKDEIKRVELSMRLLDPNIKIA
jgi:ATP-dependent Clp protease ATP-binding subunit ClpA